MKNNQFFAMLSRMKYINRWGQMRNTIHENDMEHSLEVAFIAHALGVINNEVFGGNMNAERLAVLGMYHDCTEIITGDMPTPVKYYSPVIRDAYKDVEVAARDQLLTGLPENFRETYSSCLLSTEEEQDLWIYVKAADKMSAWIKCLQELSMGNQDFAEAAKSTEASVRKMNLREVNYFIEHFLPGYTKTLDELMEPVGR
ncbi:MAG: 5'-deoxynucleotidase [Lachnospiraceae bacterium]|nr:5'-deoxynucleotidase [Lachnospiraceae bacterium]